jgi:hypothetical protein
MSLAQNLARPARRTGVDDREVKEAQRRGRNGMHFARRLALISATVLAMGASATPAPASSQAASGSFTEGPETITSEQFADGNQIYTLTREAVFSGTYQGVGQAEQRIVIHKDGSANLQMTIAFTGLACGQPATLTFNVSATVDFVNNTFAGHYAVIGGEPGEHAPRGHGTFSGTPGTGGIYDGSIKCD